MPTQLICPFETPIVHLIVESAQSNGPHQPMKILFKQFAEN